ncbi:MAG: ABC transporter permease, partial [Nitrososphaerales archaeon]
DLMVGLLYGFPVALGIGIITAVVTTIIGTFGGIVSGYVGGKTDTVLQRTSDILSNIPLLPLLIFLIFVLGPRLWLVVVVLIIFGWPGLTIIVRSMVLQLRSGQSVEAARALGASRSRIMTKHLFPQIAPFVFAQMVFTVPGAILAEAGLSFLGLGDPSIPTWGQLLQSGFTSGAVYIGLWWWVLPPGLLIVLTAMIFVFIALGVEPVVNPRLRRVA